MIEDELLAHELGLNKTMYEPAELIHNCGLCHEEQIYRGFRLKLEHVKDWHQPAIFICSECYQELPNEPKGVA